VRLGAGSVVYRFKGGFRDKGRVIICNYRNYFQIVMEKHVCTLTVFYEIIH